MKLIDRFPLKLASIVQDSELMAGIAGMHVVVQVTQ